MYTKLFGKILDSSVWMTATPTRIVWITLLAAMNQDGFAAFASPANLAHRAIVTLDECTAALAVLEGPDPHSADPDHEGRRIERVPGGWVILNAKKYRDLVSEAESRRLHRERQQRYRDGLKSRACVTPRDATVTPRDAPVTPRADHVTQEEAEAERDADGDQKRTSRPARATGARDTSPRFLQFWAAYPRKVNKAGAVKAWQKLDPDAALLARMIVALDRQRQQPGWQKDGGQFIPHAATWLRGRRWEDEAIDATEDFDAQFDRVAAGRGRLQ